MPVKWWRVEDIKKITVKNTKMNIRCNIHALAEELTEKIYYSVIQRYVIHFIHSLNYFIVWLFYREGLMKVCKIEYC